MPRYEARVDLVGSSADLEKSFEAASDAAGETADKLEESFSRASDTVSGQLSGLGKDGAEQLAAVGDAGEESAGRLTDAFTTTTGTVSGLLDDMAGKADEKSGLISKSFDKSFAMVGDQAETMTGRVTEALDGTVTATDERSATISGSLERAFAAGGDASGVMVTRLGETLDAMVTETTQKAALITARLDQAYAKAGVAASKLKAANESALTSSGKVATGQAGSADVQLAAKLEQIEALQKSKALTAEEAEAARSKAIGSIATGNLSQDVGTLGYLHGQHLISDAEYADAKGKLVGLSKTAEEEGGKVKGIVAKIFSGAAGTLGNIGIPGAEHFEKAAQNIEAAKAEGRGKGLVASASAVGGTALGVGSVIGVGALVESVHLSDQLDTAQVQLKTAVKATGEAWKTYEPELDKVISRTEALGFTNTETESALASLTTATQSPKKAVGDLGLAMEIARAKNISLADAAQVVTKLLGGSTRGLQQYGINLDIGSGKLHSIQQATEAVTKDQLSLKEAQQAASQAGVEGGQKYTQALLSEKAAANALAAEHVSGSNAVANALLAEQTGLAEVESGQVKGAAAVGLLKKNQMDLTEAVQSGSFKNTAAALAYEKAQKTVADTQERSSYAQVAALERVTKANLTLDDAQKNLKEDQQAIPEALATLNKRFSGADLSYVQTLPGQLKVLDAEVVNLGGDFGEHLVPKLEEAGAELEKIFNWFQKNKGAAEALGGVVAGALSLAVAVFVEQKLAKLVRGLGKAYDDLKGLASAAGRLFGGKGTGSSGTGTGTLAPEEKIGSAATTMKSAAETMQRAADKMSSAGDKQETAGEREETAGTREETAGTREIAAGTEEDAAATELGGKGGAGGLLGKLTGLLKGGGKLGALADALPAGVGIAAGAAGAAYLGYREFRDLQGGLAKLSPTEHAYTGFGSDIGATGKLATDTQSLETYLGALTDVIKGKALSSSLVNQIGAEGPGGGADVNQLATWLHRTAGNQATGQDIISSLLGLEQHTQLTSAEKAQIDSLIGDVHKTLLTGGKTSGAALTQGLGEGISSGAGIANNAATRSAQGIVTKTKDVYKQHSPSLVFHEIGADLMTSEAAGISQNMHFVLDALSRLETQVQKDMAKIGVLSGSSPSAPIVAGRAGPAPAIPASGSFPNMNSHYDIHDNTFVTSDANQVFNQIKVKARRANLVRT